jgi:hypothetical protein
MNKNTLKILAFWLAVFYLGSCKPKEEIKQTPEPVPVATVPDNSQFTISSPPDSLKLDPFYKKYVKVNGIHIMSSHKVPDDAIFAACRTIKSMTGMLPENVLSEMTKRNTRVGIMGRYEGTTDIPEHKYLESDTTLNWDLRARGLGGTLETPLTTCAEENLLCYQIDKYHAEDILIHEFAHSIHGIGIISVDTAFNTTLQKALDKALAEGKYVKAYAATDIHEYFAEGVQDWFGVNAEVPVPDGKHNHVNTRAELKAYDPVLYDIIKQFFPETDETPSCHAKANLYTE